MAKKTEMIGFKCHPELRKKLEQMAKDEDRTISYIVHRTLTTALKDIPVNVVTKDIEEPAKGILDQEVTKRYKEKLKTTKLTAEDAG